VVIHRLRSREDMQKTYLTSIFAGICEKPNSAGLTFLQVWGARLVIFPQSFQLAFLDAMVADEDDWFRHDDIPFTI
jgi:hypothetical protein